MVLKEEANWKRILREHIFEGNTLEGMVFEIILALAIIISVIAVILESIKSVQVSYGNLLLNIEWFFTILFTIEYILRSISAKSAGKYIFSLYGVIDLISTIPLYLSIMFKGEEILQVVRLLRLIRVFSRSLKVIHKLGHLSKANDLRHHLSTNEKVILFFRPSRKSILFKYGIIMFLIILSLIEIFFNILSSYIPFLNIIAYIVLFISVIIIIRFEIRILSVKYAITNQRIFYLYGILKENFKGVTYQYITDISLNKTLLDKILNTGTVIVHTAGGDANNLEIKNISNPLKIKNLINEGITRNRG